MTKEELDALKTELKAELRQEIMAELNGYKKSQSVVVGQLLEAQKDLGKIIEAQGKAIDRIDKEIGALHDEFKSITC